MIGIIAEFDPFHNGHKYFVDKIKELYPNEKIIAVMSGYFTQRGEAAIIRPNIRAEMAIKCGIDLVLELPIIFSVATAERFAYGGVSVLNAIGANKIIFGSECGSVEMLSTIATALGDKQYNILVRNELKNGCTYAKARQNVITQMLGENMANILSNANDLLGIEYILAGLKINPSIKFEAIKRVSVQHNSSDIKNNIASASMIRKLIYANDEENYLKLVPENIKDLLITEIKNNTIASLCNAEKAILYRLRTMSKSDFANLPDVSEGIENRLYKFAKTASVSEYYELVKTKRYTLSRIKRLTLYAFLQITKADFISEVPYIRVLAMNDNGIDILHSCKKACEVPIITKPALYKKSSANVQEIFTREQAFKNIYFLCLQDNLKSYAGQDMQITPYYGAFSQEKK